MTRPILNDGDIWQAQYANAAGFPIPDGADEYGHGPKIIDDYLDDASDMIKARFYGWYNRVQVTEGTGLQVNYTGAPIRLPDGSNVNLSAGSLTLTNNATGFIYIDNTGAIQFGSTLPPERIVLATYVTASGAITALNDVRKQVSEVVTPESISSAAIFDIGDIKTSARVNPPTGWLHCDGMEYAVSTYPSLYAAIGNSYNLPTTPVGQFRVPDCRGRALVGASTSHPLGDEWGAETKRLSISEIPSHTHVATQGSHTHGVIDNGHIHTINDSGHSHNYTDSTVIPQGNPGSLGYASGSIYSRDNSSEIRQTNTSTLGISVRNHRSNVSIAPSSAPIAVQAQGGGGSFSLHQPSVAMNVFIRAT